MKNIQTEEKKIIICKGTTYDPARFWSWIVCTEDEFTEKMKENGWVKSTSTKHLTPEQLNYLNEAV